MSTGVAQPFNGTAPTGGDSLTTDLNIFYSAGDIAWLLTSTALVLLMIPGVGFFYSGLARRRNALSLLWLSVMATAVTSFQWFFWGYSLTYSHQASSFIGALDNFGLMGVLAQPSVGSSRVPDLLFCVYQGMFACLTVTLAVGAVAERGRMLPCIIFMFVWSTLVYDTIACWTWNPAGWIYQLGGLDFAGGTPVHISSGCAALAYSYMLGKRSGFGTQKLNYRPHNINNIVVGTAFLWVGWFGFNAGSALAANMRAVMAAVVTNLAAGVAGVTWCLVDYRLEKKWSTVGLCSGVVAGLVAITPGSGFVPAWAAVIYGICAGLICNFGTQIKYWISADDALDIFAIHGVGGLLGNLLTGIFAADYIAHLDGTTEISGGWLNGHWVQVAIHLADSVAGATFSFACTLIILFILARLGRFIPCLRLRVDEEEEDLGIDDVELGEFAYDFVEVTRHLNPLDVDEEYEEEDGESHSGTGIMAGQKTHDESYPMRSMSVPHMEEEPPEMHEAYRTQYQGPFEPPVF